MKTSLALLVSFALSVCLAFKTQGQSAEYAVKAAYLYNFAKFIDWPAQAFSNSASPFTICLDGDPFATVLDRIVEGDNLDGHPLAIRRIDQSHDIHGCQIIYIGHDENHHAGEILKLAESSPILTVGESPAFIADGGMVRFVTSAGKVRFQINPDAAERVSLKLSSRLLKVAEIVHSKEGGGR